MYTIRFTKLNENARVPQKAHDDDAGFDLYASESVTVPARGFASVPTGLSIELPEGTEAQVRPRSGLAARYGVTVLNAPGTIDAGYRGEVKVLLVNHSDTDFEAENGMRIAQLILSPVLKARFIESEELTQSDRGTGGFGSTGTN